MKKYDRAQRAARKRLNPAEMPDTRRQEILPEETMLNDLYLMSANPYLEAATRRNFEHRALTYSEMSAPEKRRNKNARTAGKRTNERAKGLLMTLLEGVLRA